jgi:hypothetical protein
MDGNTLLRLVTCCPAALAAVVPASRRPQPPTRGEGLGPERSAPTQTIGLSAQADGRKVTSGRNESYSIARVRFVMCWGCFTSAGQV